jgi:eukaryotic-like serine/threonine-protein kinase
MAELMYKIANEDAPDIRVIRKDIPERLANIVALSLGKRPEARYQDGNVFAGDLRSVLAELSSPTGATVAPAARASAAPTFEATVVGVMPASGPPRYDPAQETDAGESGAFDKTAVISKPGQPGVPAAGAYKTDPEA